MALKLVIVSILIVMVAIYPTSPEAQWVSHRPPLPLCVSQLALVNRACGRLPYTGQRGHVETADEEECCRWLKEVDTLCVCDLLVHLPPFMTRPVHEYKVVVDDSCHVTFTCASRLLNF